VDKIDAFFTGLISFFDISRKLSDSFVEVKEDGITLLQEFDITEVLSLR